MARVFKRNGAYWIDFLDADGVRHRKKGGPTKRIATELLRDTLGKVVRQEHLGLLDSKVAFSDYATRWVENMRTKVKARSYVQYEAITRLHLIPAFPGSLKALSHRQVEAYIAKRLDEGAKPSTVNVSLAVLKAIVRAAVRERHLARNPLDGLRPIKSPAGRVRFLSHDEITKLLDACAAAPADSRVPGAYLKPFVLFALNTGMRRNEIAFLARRHVDWTARVATLTDTKSGKPRLVPLNDAAIAALKAVPPRLDTDRFFPFAPLDLTRAFGRAVESAGHHGLPPARLPAHLRELAEHGGRHAARSAGASRARRRADDDALLAPLRRVSARRRRSRAARHRSPDRHRIWHPFGTRRRRGCESGVRSGRCARPESNWDLGFRRPS